jgi:hypothetical protein
MHERNEVKKRGKTEERGRQEGNEGCMKERKKERKKERRKGMKQD